MAVPSGACYRHFMAGRACLILGSSLDGIVRRPTHIEMLQRLNFPLATGQAARLLDLTEPQLAETVRRGKVDPPPPVRAGRRMWTRDNILQAAAALGILTDELRAKLGEEVSQ